MGNKPIWMAVAVQPGFAIFEEDLILFLLTSTSQYVKL